MKFYVRLRALFRKEQLDQQLSSELAFHLEKQTEQNLAAGMSAEEARYAALRKFGGVEQVKEECRDTWGVRFIDTLLQDIRFGLRMLAKNPGFTAVAVLTLALGIGANTAVFSLVNGIMLRPLPYPLPDGLVTSDGMFPKGFIVALREQSRTMDVATYSLGTQFNLTGQGEPVRLQALEVSTDLFSVLGVHPALGRSYQPNEDRPGQSNVVILSHSIWEQRFGRDPKVIGSFITLDDVPRQVIGVMGEDFRFASPAIQLWVPMEVDPANLWGNFQFSVLGRLHPGMSVSQALAEFHALTPNIVKTFPWPMPKGWGSGNTLLLLQEFVLGSTRPKLFILLGAVTLVLLIACANVANLLLNRDSSRHREIAIRAALGGGRGRIVRQLLTEGVLLAFGGGVLGLAVSFQGLRFLRLLLPADTPRLADVVIDWHVLAFTALLAVTTGLAFGLAPALHVVVPNLEQELKANAGRIGVGPGQRRVSAFLVIAEVALAFVIVISAGLLVKALWVLTQRNPGFQPDRLLTARIDQIGSRCKLSARCVAFYNDVLQRVRALPGVVDAAAVDGLPGPNPGMVPLAVEGRPSAEPGATPAQSWSYVVTPDYLRTMRISLLRGRLFTDADNASAQPVVLVSATAARSFWPGHDPLGKRIRLSWRKDWRVVVGVVADVRESGLADSPGWATNTRGDVYYPYSQGILAPPAAMTLVIRTHGNPENTATSVRAAVMSVDASIPVSNLKVMNQVLGETIATPRSTMWLFLTFAILALLLGAIGIYSVISFSVTQRTHEIGVRMALGAGRSVVLRQVLIEGTTLALIGIAVGLGGALIATRFLTGLLYGVPATDPATFLVVTLILAGTAILSTYIPARRATKVDPMVALRYE